MAAVPISQIPNAPQGAGPVLQDHLPGISPLQPLNLGGGLDASGLGRAQALMARGSDTISQGNEAVARATAANKRDLIDPTPFVNAAGAGEFVGKALQHAGEVGENFAQRMLEAKDARDLMQVDDILHDAVDEQRLKISNDGTSPDQWVPTWNASQPEVLKRIEALGISPRIRQKVADGIASFWGRQTMSFAIDATKQSLSDAGENLRASVQKAVARQDFEGAFKRIQDGVSSRILSASQGEALREGVESTHRDNLVNIALAEDPQSVLDDLLAAGKTGSSARFPWLDPTQRLRVKSMALTGVRQRRVDAIDSLDDSIASGKFTTPEQVQAFGKEHRLPADVLQSKIKGMQFEESQTPAAQARYLQAQNDIIADMRQNYHPPTDPDQKQYLAYQNRINSTLPEGKRLPVLQELRDMRTSGLKPSATAEAGIVKIATQLNEQGFVNVAGFDKKDPRKIVDPEAAQRSIVAQTQLLEQIHGWFQENPKLTSAEAYQRLQDITKSRISGNAAEKAVESSTSQPGWFPYLFPFGAGVQWMKRKVEAPEPGQTNPGDEQQPGGEAAPGPAPTSSISPGKEAIAQKLVAAANKGGISPGYFVAMSMQESNLNPETRVPGASARGLFGMLDEDRRKFGLGDQPSVEADIQGGVEKTRENVAAARKALGRNPTDGELYVVHYQGIGAGPAILKNPGGSFEDTLNKFGDHWYGKVLKANPWLAGIKTNQDFIDWATDRIEQRKREIGLA